MPRNHLLGLFVLLLSTPAAEGTPFPYRAIVLTQQADIRSGPGDEFYATGRIQQGAEVEVYKHKNNEWCAIRPPAGSFSWVLADAVEATSRPGVVKVKTEGIRTRVGSQLQTAHNVAYVRLRAGELLTAIGPGQTLPGTSRLAFRVEPPSGEFRWIHHRFLERPEAARKPTASQSDRRKATAKQPPRNQETQGSGVKRASHEGEIPLQKLPSSTMTTFPIPNEAAPVRTDESEAVIREVGSQSDPAGDLRLNDQLNQIDLRLSETVSEPIKRWNLEPLQAKLNRIVESGDPTSIRRATDLLIRIGDFAEIQRRHRQLAHSADAGRASPVSSPDAAVPNSLWQAVPPSPAALEAARPVPNFGGQGWLIPVFTKRRDLPRFALTDDDGSILYFVRPKPGLNLRRYLRQRVGIMGSATHTTSAEPSQLVAERVVVLDRHQR